MASSMGAKQGMRLGPLAAAIASLAVFLTLVAVVLSTARHSPPLYHHGPCEPHEVHIALTDSDREMRLTWRTRSASCSSKVAYGSREDLLVGTALTANNSGPVVVTEDDMCSAPANSDSFTLYIHNVVLSNLDHDREYHYSLSDDSTIYNFKSAPKTHHKARFTFIAFGDMGAPNNPKCKRAKETFKMVHKDVEGGQVDLVAHVGDISYANGRAHYWDSFMRMIQPVSSRVPYMVTIGNHEYDYKHGVSKDPSGTDSPYHPSWGNYGRDSGGECGAMTATRFSMPALTHTANAPFWYSFRYGSVHFVAVSTEHDISRGTRQYAWLKRELHRVDRSATPWVVLLLHRPMYVVYPHKSNRRVGDHIRSSIEHLLHKHRVDLTIAGHVHSYYRSCKVYKGACHARGIMHFVMGTGGHELSGQDKGQGEWCVGHADEHGYGRFTVNGRDSIKFEFVRADDGKVLDHVVIEAAASQATQSAATQSVVV